MKHVIIIPARYESTRLPGKPLVEIDGLPMVVRTWQQCVKACDPRLIYVATEDDRIKKVCDVYGIQVLMTSSDCLTGTDRVAECAQMIDADYFINVQGDEPLFHPADITKLIEEIKNYPGQILNGFCAIKNEKDFRSTAVPKVVVRADGRLLYMSRSAIPLNKKNEYVKAWRQVCAYVFPKQALEAFRACAAKTPLEEIEDIEILRFLELGYEVRMIELSDKSIPVDFPEDIIKVEKALHAQSL